MQRVLLGSVLIAIVSVPAVSIGQWRHYPTADVPRKSRRHSQSDGGRPATAGRQARLLGPLARGGAQPVQRGPHSTARWESDTLVVQTIGFRDGLWIDLHGSPMSDAAKMTERLRRPNYGTLEVEITVDDPKVYTRPWTVRMDQVIELDTDLIDEFRLENEKSYKRMQRSRGK